VFRTGTHISVFGRYEYHKWRRTLYVTVYLMRVTSVEDDWQEAAIRSRSWAHAAEARQLLVRANQRQMLEAAVARPSGE